MRGTYGLVAARPSAAVRESPGFISFSVRRMFRATRGRRPPTRSRARPDQPSRRTKTGDEQDRQPPPAHANGRPDCPRLPLPLPFLATDSGCLCAVRSLLDDTNRATHPCRVARSTQRADGPSSLTHAVGPEHHVEAVSGKAGVKIALAPWLQDQGDIAIVAEREPDDVQLFVGPHDNRTGRPAMTKY
jgi:hypothetical protein